METKSTARPSGDKSSRFPAGSKAIPQHTPGPWRILDGAILSETVNDYGNFHIARYDRGDADLTPQDHANARLIKAAPDLLAALRFYRNWADDNPDAPNRLNGAVSIVVDEAIALTEI